MSGGPKWTKSDKPRDLKAAMISFLRYAGPHRKEIAAGVLCSLAAAALTLIGPQYLSAIADSISDSILGGLPVDVHGITITGLMLIAIYSASTLFSTAQNYIIGASSERIGARMRNDLSEKIDRVPLSYLDSCSTGDIMSRMTNDTDTISNSCGESITGAITSVTMLFGSMTMMLYTDYRLAVFAMIPAGVGFLILYYITHRTQRYFVAQQRDLGALNGLIEETYYGHDIVKVYNDERRAKRRFSEINGSLYNSAFKARVITGMVPQIMNFISNLSYVVVCVVGSMLIVEGSIGYGVIVAFILYVRQFTQPVAHIADSVAMMQSVASASERIFEFLDVEEMDESEDMESLDIHMIRGDVEFRDVHFGYLPDIEVIHGLNLKVDAGSKIAIVGPTGAGKTTIANLLLRFYDVGSGEILVDGMPINSMSRSQVRSLFSMVLQDAWMFGGTIRENIAFTRTDADDRFILECCEAVGIKQFIESLPDGLDTVMSDASSLSVGQRQQMTIARAMVKDAPMIILDEATSSVDTRTEKHIQEAMDRLTEGRTSFVIAHRLSTIMNSDMIIVMRDGAIVEHGTHGELLRANGFYKMLFNSQFEGCE